MKRVIEITFLSLLSLPAFAADFEFVSTKIRLTGPPPQKVTSKKARNGGSG